MNQDSIRNKINQTQDIYKQGLIPEGIYLERINQYMDELEQLSENLTESKCTKPQQQSADRPSHSSSSWDYEGSTEQQKYPEVGMVLRERYELIKVAGQGGMGTVYQALDKQASEVAEKDTYCAIKIVAPILQHDVQAIASLKQEALRSKDLRHDNIVQVYDFDSDNQYTWLTMEWLEGQSLSAHLANQLIEKKCGFSETEIIQWLERILFNEVVPNVRANEQIIFSLFLFCFLASCCRPRQLR